MNDNSFDMNDLIPSLEDIILPAELDDLIHKRVAALPINSPVSGICQGLFPDEECRSDCNRVDKTESESFFAKMNNSVKSSISKSLPSDSVHLWSKNMMYPLSRTNIRRCNTTSEEAERSVTTFLNAFSDGFSYEYIRQDKYWSCNAICKESCKFSSFHLRLFRDIDSNEIVFEFQKRSGCPLLSLSYFKTLKSFLEGTANSDSVNDIIKRFQQPVSMGYSNFNPNISARWLSADCNWIETLKSLTISSPDQASQVIGSIVRRRSASSPPSLNSDIRNNMMTMQNEIFATTKNSALSDELRPGAVALSCESIRNISKMFPLPACHLDQNTAYETNSASEEVLSMGIRQFDPCLDLFKAIIDEKAVTKSIEIALCMACLTSVLAATVFPATRTDIGTGKCSLVESVVNNKIPTDIGSETDLHNSLESILPNISEALSSQPSQNKHPFHRQCASILLEQIMQSENLSMNQRIKFISALG